MHIDVLVQTAKVIEDIGCCEQKFQEFGLEVHLMLFQRRLLMAFEIPASALEKVQRCCA